MQTRSKLRANTMITTIRLLLASVMWIVIGEIAWCDNQLSWSSATNVSESLWSAEILDIVSVDGSAVYALIRGLSDQNDMRPNAYVTSELDDGSGWISPVQIDDLLMFNNIGTLSALVNGRVYVAYVADAAGASSGVFVRASSDFGRTWSEARNVAGESSALCCYLFMGSDDSGNVCVVYGDGYSISANVSNDYGVTWQSMPFSIEQLEGNKRLLGLTRGASNQFYALVAAGSDLTRNDELYLLVSLDGGRSWNDPVLIDSSPPPTISAELSADSSGNIYAAWSDNTGAAYFNHTAHWGQVVDPVLEMAAAGTAGGISITSTCRGAVFVAWHSAPHASMRGVFVARSLMYGAGFEAPQLISNASEAAVPTRVSIVANSSDYVAVVWQDDRRGVVDVWSTSTVDLGETWIAEDTQINLGIPESYDRTEIAVSLSSVGRAFVGWGGWSEVETHVVYVARGQSPILVSAGSSSIEVPSGGGRLTADLSICNVGIADVLQVECWLDCTLPDGRISNPVFGPIGVTRLRSGRCIARSRVFLVPARLPAGNYSLNLRVGEPVDGVGSICLLKR